MTTRKQVAHYVAAQLPQHRRQVLREAAAWLIATGRTRQADYLAQDIAMILAQNGHLAVRVTTARAIDPKIKTEIESFLRRLTKAEWIELTAHVDPTLIGGMELTTPDGVLDTTIRSKLATLTAQGGRR
jgi:F0F1-type ATP synthase delta subunit